MTAQTKTTKNTQTPSYSHLHYLIWGMVLLTLIISILINQRVFLLDMLSQGPLNSLITTKNPSLVGSLTLELESAETIDSLQPLQTYTATINLDTKNKSIVAADAYITYDPDMIKIIAIEEGVVFPTHPTLDFSASKGIMTISGIMPIRENFAGQGVMAKIRFQPLQKGSTELSFQYEPEQTNDSNIVELGSAADILGSAKNLTLTIK